MCDMEQQPICQHMHSLCEEQPRRQPALPWQARNASVHPSQEPIQSWSPGLADGSLYFSSLLGLDQRRCPVAAAECHDMGRAVEMGVFSINASLAACRSSADQASIHGSHLPSWLASCVPCHSLSSPSNGHGTNLQVRHQRPQAADRYANRSCAVCKQSAQSHRHTQNTLELLANDYLSDVLHGI